MAQTPIIMAEEVTKRFGTHQVLTRVSLPVMERDVVCVVGPSGSGKTTLLRCFALLEAPLRVKGMARDEAVAMAEKLLAKVDLSDKRDAYPARLSGGQQQRVAIARALAMSPKVLLFDEATSALDPELRREVLLVMRQLAAEGMTMVVVTHEMGFARHVGTRTVFMDRGEIVEEAPGAAFFDAPRTERARRFLQQFEE